MKEVYQVLSGMIGQEERVAQIANNLANLNTLGFKKQGLAFQDCLKTAVKAVSLSSGEGAMSASAKSAQMAWPTVGSAFVDYTMGPLQTTGRTLDMAIEGEGFFQVASQKGETFYTRAGNFTLDATGQLATANGDAVLDDVGRPIRLNPQGGAPQVSDDGTIRQGGAVVGRVGIVRFQDPQRLVRQGGSLLQAPAGVAAEPVKVPRVRSGMLEGSNVDAIREMVDMIETQRAYDLNQKVMQTRSRASGSRPPALNRFSTTARPGFGRAFNPANEEPGPCERSTSPPPACRPSNSTSITSPTTWPT
jgi:flagellar basal-body rod protein FlgF